MLSHYFNYTAQRCGAATTAVQKFGAFRRNKITKSPDWLPGTFICLEEFCKIGLINAGLQESLIVDLLVVCVELGYINAINKPLEVEGGRIVADQAVHRVEILILG